MNNKEYSIFHVEGGLGKNVAATAVAKCIKNNHKDRELIVVASYPEVFLNLPYVKKVFPLGNVLYFHEDYIKGRDSLIFKQEPYWTADHIYGRKHLIENWCNVLGLKYKGETPELKFTYPLNELSRSSWNRGRPIMVLQTNGGPMDGQPLPFSWARDMPMSLSKRIVEEFKDEYHIIQVCRHESNIIGGTEPFTKRVSNMEFLSLLLSSTKRVLIDSSLHHAAAALNLPSTVMWVTTSPSVFGYEMHSNIVCDIPEHKLPNAYLFNYSFHGNMDECPFENDNIFDPGMVIDIIKRT